MNNKEVENIHNKLKERMRKEGFKEELFKTVAVGWLDVTEEYEKGDVSEEFVKKLRKLFETGPMIATLGFHECEFCITEGKEPHKSSREKILPDYKNKIEYIFPGMIFHYMEVHNYKPPKRFIEYVMREANRMDEDLRILGEKLTVLRRTVTEPDEMEGKISELKVMAGV